MPPPVAHRASLSPFRSRLALRVFLLFVVCALGPLAAFAVYGSWQAREQIEDQAARRLHMEARTLGQSLVEHLNSIEVELRILKRRIEREEGPSPDEILEYGHQDLKGLRRDVDGLALLESESGSPLVSVGAAQPLPPLDDADRAHLAEGRTLLHARVGDDGRPELRLLVPTAGDRILEAHVRPEPLWASTETDADLAVFDEAGELLFATFSDEADVSPANAKLATSIHNGHFQWAPDEVAHRASYRRMFLEPSFGTVWTLVCSRPEDELFAAVESFRRGFLLTGLLTLWIVMFASVTLIRRRMVPIDRLTQATQKMAAGDLAIRVEVDTDDELGELGAAFNTMAQNVETRRNELEVALRARDEFLSKVSHELRTPMTAILGYIDLCRDQATSDRDRNSYLGIVSSNGRHLLSVINDVLDVARIAADGLTVERAWCDPRAIVESTAELLQSTARTKGVELSLSVDDALPRRAWTDETRFRQVLLNVIGNAVKFTERGSVRVRCALRPAGDASDRGGRLAIVVEDTGIGMTPAQQAVVFEPFVQADSSMTRRFGGSGLGLSISRSLARLLGGDLTCESAAGRGSTFTITIDPTGPVAETAPPEPEPAEPAPALPEPAPKPAPPSSGPAAADDARAGRILLAEDVAVNRRLVAMLLQKDGFTVVEAENGRVAMDLALEARSEGRAFDVLLMDMQMPVMDGYEAVQRLRSAGYSGPIVALTAHSMPEERDRCLAIGCDEFQGKPVNRDMLLEAVRRLATRGTGASRSE